VLAPVAIVRVETLTEPGESTMDGLVNDIVSPCAVGEDDPFTLAVPVSPRLVKVRVEVVEPPATKLAGDGEPTARVKSRITVTLTVVLCETEPLVPITATV
jgi:hypothetical protein